MEEEVREPANGEALPKSAEPHHHWNCKRSWVPPWPLKTVTLHRPIVSVLSKNSTTASQQCKMERVRTKFDRWILLIQWYLGAFPAWQGCCNCHHPVDGTEGSEFPPPVAPAAARWPSSLLMTVKHPCWFHCLRNSVEDLKHGFKYIFLILGIKDY